MVSVIPNEIVLPLIALIFGLIKLSVCVPEPVVVIPILWGTFPIDSAYVCDNLIKLLLSLITK